MQAAAARGAVVRPEPAAPAALRAGMELELCDCEQAAGSPDGLSCGKEGWFISSFEREGSWVRARLGLARSRPLRRLALRPRHFVRASCAERACRARA